MSGHRGKRKALVETASVWKEKKKERDASHERKANREERSHIIPGSIGQWTVGSGKKSWAK